MKNNRFLRAPFIGFLIFILMMLTSCSTFNASLESLLVSPKSDNILIEGMWRLDKFYYMYNKNSGVTPKIPDDSYLFLSNEYVRINDLIFYYKEFKVKTCMLSDYMRIRFKIDDFSFLSLEDKSVNVFSVEGENKNIYEFILYDNDTLLFYYDDDIMYIFNRISEKIDDTFEEYVKNNYKNNILDNSRDIEDTGFLVSFRSKREIVDSSIPKNKYKTFWFYQKSDGTYGHEVFDNIVIPKNGDLLTIKVESSDKNNLYEKIVVDTSNNNKRDIDINKNEEFINQFIDITYLNENYIGISYDQNVEYLGYINTDKWAMLSIDDPRIEKRLKFSDIFDNNVERFYASYDKFLSFVRNNNLSVYDTNIREDSFSLERYGGDWFLKGRINPKNKNSKSSPLDFDIEVLPNEELIGGNYLSINLGEIKLRYPDAIDAFISPNRDILVVLTPSIMGIYKVLGDKVSNNSILEFPLEDGDKLISANWYTGNESIEINKLIEEFK